MIAEVLYYIFIYPMQTLLGAVFEWIYAYTHSYGWAIVLLSVAINLFLLKLTNLADKKAQKTNALKSICDTKIAEFKKVFRGSELHAYTQTLFKQKHYHPIYNLFSLGGLALQISFFLGVLFLLQDFEGLRGAKFGVIEDLSKPDTLLFGYALLPFVMSALSFISVFISGTDRGARIQGSLIAVIFLVLLYAMPSGLVLYWTISTLCILFKLLWKKRVSSMRNAKADTSLNNEQNKSAVHKEFDTHAKQSSFVGRFVTRIFTPYAMLDSKTYVTYRNISIFALLNIFFLIFVFSPFAVYSSDVSQFDPNQTFQTLGGLFGFFLLSSFLGIYITSFFYKTPLLKIGVYSVSVILCIGLVYTFIFTGNIFNGPHAPLDHLLFQDGGGALRHAYNAYADILIGFIVMFLVLMILRKIRYLCLKIFKIIFFASFILAFVSLVKIVQAWAIEQDIHDSMTQNDQAVGNIPTYTQTLLSFSKEEPNILVLVLDAFTGSHIEILLDLYPHLARELDGFIYFDNTISGAGFTHLTTPSLIGGEYYTTYNLLKRGVNPEIIDSQSYHAGDEAFKSMAEIFAKAGYQVDLHNIAPSRLNTNDINNTLINISSSEHGEYSGYFLEHNPKLIYDLESKIKNTLPIADLATIGLFKFSSFRTRGWLYPEAWRFGSNLKIEHVKREIIKSSAYLSFPELSDTQAKKPTFKYIKTLVTHSPWSLDTETCTPSFSEATILPERYKKYVYDKTYYTYMNNEFCALKTLVQWIDFLKQNGIYDNTQLFVVSDHGAWYTFKQMEQNYGIRIGHNFNPLVMVKDFKNRGVLHKDSRLIANYDIATIFCENIPGGCKNVQANILRNYPHDRKIPFVHLQSGKIIDSYVIQDNVYNPKNWQEVDPKTFMKER
ncbi:YidC/Oxa1 family membrane protein insertase [uncultured Helicobacter sp.]|uniref:YidC/Oxa1 family membrane protein insertase n=1 Tax=uncultured Helicobacter sp. TaxID=175537 RepID=UPI00374EE6BF